MSATSEQLPPNRPPRIDFPSPDSLPEYDEHPTVPPPMIDDPEQPSPRMPDEGDIEENPLDPRTHGDEGSP